MSESISVPLILLAYFKKPSLFIFFFEALQLQSCKQSQMCLSLAFSPLESMGIYTVHKLNAYITIHKIKALLSTVKKKEQKIKSCTFFVSKANLKSFIKCYILAILLREEMPNLSLSWILDIFKKCYITFHAVAEYKWSFIDTQTSLRITSFSIKSLLASLPIEGLHSGLLFWERN